MTVAELIESLQKLPPDIPVAFNDGEYGWMKVNSVILYAHVGRRLCDDKELADIPFVGVEA